MFTMILLAHTKAEILPRHAAKGGKSMAKRKQKSTCNEAVQAYGQSDKRFDPYGSYTGRNGKDVPCQDADDL